MRTLMRAMTQDEIDAGWDIPIGRLGCPIGPPGTPPPEWTEEDLKRLMDAMEEIHRREQELMKGKNEPV